jgi:tetratricopeptide (TPR) repeat protein
MKRLNDIAKRFLAAGFRGLLLSAVLMLVACASWQPGKVIPPPLKMAGPEVQVEDTDILALSPAMREFLERYVLEYPSSQTRLELLTLAITSSGVLNFKYDEKRTLTAAEAFEARAGNCIGFANMMVALARAAGLDAHYQEVLIRPEWSDYEDDTVLLFNHVNVVIDTLRMSWVVDVSGMTIRPTERRRIIDDSYAKALYLNNIAVESLLVNDLPTAYAYMRKAVEADSRATDPWVNLGVLYGRNDQLDDAAFAFNRALAIDPAEHSAMSNLYEVYLEQGKLDLAADIEARVERYRRKNPYYLLKLSDQALANKQYRESIELLKRAIEKKDDDYKLHFALAKTQYLSGELVAAQESLLRARELAPADVVAYYDRPLQELVEDK